MILSMLDALQDKCILFRDLTHLWKKQKWSLTKEIENQMPFFFYKIPPFLPSKWVDHESSGALHDGFFQQGFDVSSVQVGNKQGDSLRINPVQLPEWQHANIVFKYCLTSLSSTSNEWLPPSTGNKNPPHTFLINLTSNERHRRQAVSSRL